MQRLLQGECSCALYQIVTEASSQAGTSFPAAFQCMVIGFELALLPAPVQEADGSMGEVSAFYLLSKVYLPIAERDWQAALFKESVLPHLS